MTIDWYDKDSHLLLNPKLPQWKINLIKKYSSKILARNHSMIWLLTSGSSSNIEQLKFVGLKKSAFVTSAEAVNQHIQATENDIWLKVLPNFHVGGLSILCRAWLSKAKVFEELEFNWCPRSFFKLLEISKATLVSVVPTQVFDIVKSSIYSTKEIRVMFVGGGALNEEIYKQAIKLGWPIVLTYGMTEACSQIATNKLEDIGKNIKPEAQLLPHILAKVTNEGELMVKSEALLSEYAYINNKNIEFKDPKVDGWLQTEDLAEIKSNRISILGRKFRQVKVLGELVHLTQLENHLRTFKIDDEFIITTTKHPRLGNEIILVIASHSASKYEDVIEDFNSTVAPYEKIRKIFYLKELPKSELGKPLYHQVIDKVKT